jgi:hypothetical protein
MTASAARATLEGVIPAVAVRLLFQVAKRRVELSRSPASPSTEQSAGGR